LDTALNPLLRLHGLEDAVDRILEAPREEIFELTVAEYGVQFGRQAEMGVPSPTRNAFTLPSHLSKATTRILRGERLEDKSPQLSRESQEEPDLPGVVPVLKVDALTSGPGLMNRRKDFLHVPGATFVIGRRTDNDEHGGRIAERKPH